MELDFFKSKICITFAAGFLKIASEFFRKTKGGLAQLARALPWHGRGHRFDSDILHQTSCLAPCKPAGGFLFATLEYLILFLATNA
jgi:hypothetical protein